MANIDELFAAPKKYDHPRLRAWRSYKNSPDTTQCHIEFRRERFAVSWGLAQLYFEAERRDGIVFVDREPWDDEFNTALVEYGFQARDEENEGRRFGYAVECRLYRLGIRFGESFYSAVLVNYLKGNGYGQHPAIASKLADIKEYAPRHGDAAIDCEGRLENALGRTVQELAGLGYEPDTGKRILNAAIAYYLDDRFSITGRAALGWS